MPLNDKDALAAFRAEIQIDRIEIQRSIKEGFDGLNKKFDEHATLDSEQFIDLNQRVAAVETTVGTVGKGFWGLFIAFISAVLGWAFSK